MAFHPGQQQRLVTDRPYSPQAAFSSGIITKAPWDSVIDFATHPSFCGMTLYPRQQTLLRLMFLETDQMTDFDRDVIEEWRRGFTQRREVFGVQPDIWERVAYLKERGFRRFPEIQAVLGRRASKGMIGGILGAEQMAYLFSLDDWQSHYGVVPGKDGYLTVVATSQSQAKRHQFRDIAMAIENCAYLQPHIASSKDYELSIRTPADLRRIGSLKAAGMVPDHEIATLHAIAMASNSDVVRGAASFALFLDEFAFMVQGTGSSKSGEEVYESAVPSLDQFDPDALIYIPSSPWTKIGQFFALYKQGSVLMRSYTEKEGVTYTRQTEESLGVDAEAEIADLTADPVKLVFQGPSWILYQDWERGPELVGRAFKRAIQPDLTSEVQQRRMRRNPEKFRVERMGQFAEVAAQYLDPDKVEAMFAPLDWREPLVSQSQGRFDRSYRIHCDPGRTGANFAMAVGHLEDAPCNGCGWTKADGGTGWASNAHICPEGGSVWPHVIIDLLHVWKPSDFPADAESGRRTIDYIQVGNDIKDVLTRFRSTEKISFDQWNSAYFLADLKQQFSPGIRVTEVTFTDKVNQERYEKFKSAMNLGWVSSYRDHFFDNGSLLEQELKFLSEKNGKVVKQDFGPVTTKDLADCVQVVTVDLLHEALDRWAAGTLTASAYGSSDTAGLRTGREFERMGFGQPGGGGGARRTGRAWQDLERQRKERGRSGFSPDRASSIRSRRG